MAAERERLRSAAQRIAVILALLTCAAPVHADEVTPFAPLLPPAETAGDICRNGAIRVMIARWQKPRPSMLDSAFAPVEDAIAASSPPELRGLLLGGCSERFLTDLLECADQFLPILPADQPVPAFYGGSKGFAAHLSNCLAGASAVGIEPFSPQPDPAFTP